MKITRKDFLNGLAWTAGSAALPGWEAIAAEAVGQTAPADYYPPLRTGMRGSHPGSFEIAHELRDGRNPAKAPIRDTGEHYDL